MGSFNTTCFASNQTIAPDDRVRVLPIVQQSTYERIQLTVPLNEGEHKTSEYGISNSECYPNAFWKPACPFLPAVYADYGRFTLTLDSELHRESARAFFMFVYRYGAAAASNKANDTPVDFRAFVAAKAPMLLGMMQKEHKFSDHVRASKANIDEELSACWEYLADAMQQNRQFVLEQRDRMRPVQLAVLHEEAYRTLIASVEATSNWEKQSNAREPMARRALATARADLADLVAKNPNRTDRMEYFLADSLSNKLARMESESTFSRVPLMRAIQPLVGRLLKGEADDELMAAVLPHLNDRYAYAQLAWLNLRITPMSYSGQDYSNQIGASYAKFVRAVSDKVTALRNQYKD